MFEFYDNLFRYWAVGLFIFLGVIILRDFGWRLPSVLGALSAFAGSSYLLTMQAILYAPVPIGILIWILSALAPVIVWLFSLSQFEDHFTLRPLHYGVAGVYMLFIIPLAFGYLLGFWGAWPAVLEVGLFLLRISILLHMVFVAWRGREDDLLEARRRFRSLYMVLVTGLVGAIIFIETWLYGISQFSWAPVLQSGALLALALVLTWHVFKADKSVILIGVPASSMGAPTLPTVTSESDPSDKHDLKTIVQRIEHDKIYLEPNLTIAGLAEKVQMPEHKLRRLVNQHMGYRNFADFLNEYRIEAAKERLADVANRRLQVLVLAMDLGYGSLGPFNRAFKARTGVTPSEYRKKALAETE
ncbi:MAG: AraC family transcriptional regulator [Kordiimonadaceae bacterium]|nr:AraC family transcriptional regulator [Kordiimonadaceae bacterium]